MSTIKNGPFCPGGACPAKEHCARYKANLNKKKEPHFPEAPYNAEKKKCVYYLGMLPGDVWQQVMDILKTNGNASDYQE